MNKHKEILALVYTLEEWLEQSSIHIYCPKPCEAKSSNCLRIIVLSFYYLIGILAKCPKYYSTSLFVHCYWSWKLGRVFLFFCDQQKEHLLKTRCRKPGATGTDCKELPHEQTIRDVPMSTEERCGTSIFPY